MRKSIVGLNLEMGKKIILFRKSVIKIRKFSGKVHWKYVLLKYALMNGVKTLMCYYIDEFYIYILILDFVNMSVFCCAAAK